jgi:hypothetical protein
MDSTDVCGAIKFHTNEADASAIRGLITLGLKQLEPEIKIESRADAAS